MTPLATRQNLLGDLSYGKVWVSVRFTAKGCAKHQECAVGPYLITQLLQLIGAQVGCRDIDKISFSGISMLPVNRITRCVDEALKLADGLRKHRRIVFLAV